MWPPTTFQGYIQNPRRHHKISSNFHLVKFNTELRTSSVLNNVFHPNYNGVDFFPRSVPLFIFDMRHVTTTLCEQNAVGIISLIMRLTPNFKFKLILVQE